MGVEDTGTQRSHNMEQGVMGIRVLKWIQVTPRWANDPVWLHDGRRRESGQGWGRTPPPYGNQAEVGEWRSQLRIV